MRKLYYDTSTPPPLPLHTVYHVYASEAMAMEIVAGERGACQPMRRRMHDLLDMKQPRKVGERAVPQVASRRPRRQVPTVAGQQGFGGGRWLPKQQNLQLLLTRITFGRGGGGGRAV